MPKLTDLQRQMADLDKKIAGEKAVAVARVCALMEELGVTADDLGLALRPPASKRPVKYRDEAGHTWTGTGQRPRWLKARLLAGATLDQFQVRK